MRNLGKKENSIFKIIFLTTLLFLLLLGQKAFFLSQKEQAENLSPYSSHFLLNEALSFKGFEKSSSIKKTENNSRISKKERENRIGTTKRRIALEEKEKDIPLNNLFANLFRQVSSWLGQEKIKRNKPVSEAKNRSAPEKKTEKKPKRKNSLSEKENKDRPKNNLEKTILSSPKILFSREKEKKKVSPPLISASSAIIAGIYDNYVFFKKNEKDVRPIASLSKLMTSLVVLENLPLDKKIVIPKKITLIETPSNSHLIPQEKLSVRDLLEMSLIVSSNQAAASFSLLLPDIAALMQKKAEELQMTRTSFVEPTGLSPLNRSTVKDLFKLTKYIWFNKPQIFEMTKIPEKEIISQKKNHHLKNINCFVKRKDFLGGKTGYTDEAGGTLISIFQWRKGREPVVIIVLNSKARFTDTEKLLKWLKDNY